MFFLISEAKSYDLAPLNVLIENYTSPTGEKKQRHLIEGPFIQTEIANRNGRLYPYPLMVECIKKYIKERMQPGQMRSYGELGHPDGTEINLERVSHYITEFNWEGKNCIGKAEIITENPCGRIVQSFLDRKLKLGVSSRGLGELDKNPYNDGFKRVLKYEMIAEDIVADPSAPQGFVDGILENKQYIIKDDGVIVECYDKLEKSLESLPKDSTLKNTLYIMQIEKFLKDLAG